MEIKRIKLIGVLTTISIMLISVNVLAQSDILATKQASLSTDLNNKNYIRIYDGQIIAENDVINKFEQIKYLKKSRAIELNLDFEKPIIIINSDKSEVESKIVEKLFAKKDFLEKFKYPLDTRLPIAINNKKLTTEEREKVFSKLTIGQINTIKYLDKEQANLKYKNLPFGVIEITVKTE